MYNDQPEPSALRQQQLAFAASIRDPQSHPAIDGVAAERMAVYRDLFFNNFKETLSSAFPVIRQVLPESRWQDFCESFFAQHRCHTPYLSRVPQEFMGWLQQQDLGDCPWLVELAQWEWTELDLFLAPDADRHHMDSDDVLHAMPILSSLARLHHFEYAVHCIGEAYIPDAPAPDTVHLLAWRKPNDDMGFMQLNDLSAALLELVRLNKHHTGQELLGLIAAGFAEVDPAAILQGGMATLTSLVNNQVVWLTSPPMDEEITS